LLECFVSTTWDDRRKASKGAQAEGAAGVVMFQIKKSTCFSESETIQYKPLVLPIINTGVSVSWDETTAVQE
jgi:hypothetical protein